MTTRPTLALAMIVRDEEAVLARCLNSVVGIVDEVVIVDTGSTDKTRQIAHGFSDKVSRLTLLDFEWCDDFSAARNFGLDSVESAWVLQLDADEILEPGCESSLRTDLVTASLDGILGLELTVRMHHGGDGKETVAGEFPGMRLFRADRGLRYEFPIHEQIRIAANRRRPTPCVISHYDADRGARKRRFDRNVPLLKRAISSRPQDPYFLSALGHEYMTAGDLHSALECFWQALQIYPNANEEAAEVARDMAICMYSTGQTEAALSGVRHYRTVYPDYTDLVLVEGRFLMNSGDAAAAEECFVTCLRMGDAPPKYATLGGVGSWRAQDALDTLHAGLAS